MSFQAMKWVYELDIYPDPHTKLLALALANYAGHDNSCYPSVKRLAKECIMSERTVQYKIKVLQSLGLVCVEPRQDRAGDQTSNLFILVEPPDATFAPPGAPNAPPLVQDLHHPGAPAAPKPTTRTNQSEPIPPLCSKFIGSLRMATMWSKWVMTRRGHRRPKMGWNQLFTEQSEWLSQFNEETAFGILEKSVINDYQGLFPPKQAHDGPKSVFQLKTIMESKKKIADDLKFKYCNEAPMGDEWVDKEKRKEWAGLIRQIRELNEQISKL